MTQQATAYRAQDSATEWGQRGDETQAPLQPIWQAYYNYAQQLRAAGHRRQAEAYYQQAQLLRNKAENRRDNQSLAGNRPFSYAEARSTTASELRRSVYVDRSLVAEAVQDRPATQAIRSRFRQVALWSASGVAIASFLLISGFSALFRYYKDELSQGTTAGSPPSSFIGCVQQATFNPIVASLKPAFDKTMRLSSAAQPLLYELNLRDTRPDDYFAGTLNPAQPSYVAFSGAADGSDARPASSLDATPAAVEVPASLAENRKSTEASPAPAEGEEPDEAGDSQEGVPVAPETHGAPSRVEPQPVETNEPRSSSSRGKSRKSVRHDYDEPNRSPDVPTASTRRGSTESNAPSGNASPNKRGTPFDTPPASERKSNTPELDDLLTSKPKVPNRPSNTAGSPPQAVKAYLNRDDVQRGMAQVAPMVKQCGQGRGGTISLKVVINQKGSISSAVPTGIYAGSPIGVCAARAVRHARFPVSGQNLTVQYPFKL